MRCAVLRPVSFLCLPTQVQDYVQLVQAAQGDADIAQGKVKTALDDLEDAKRAAMSRLTRKCHTKAALPLQQARRACPIPGDSPTVLCLVTASLPQGKI